mgnify:CR=1 FL=1
MASLSFKIVELFIFCMFATGAGNFISINFGLGYPWIYFILLIGTFFISALNSKSKFNFDIIWITIFVACLGYAFSFLLETQSIKGFTIYVMPFLGFLFCYLFVMQSNKRLKTILKYLRFSLIVLCLSMVIEPFILFRDFGYLADGLRLSGFAGNANLAAFYIIAHLTCIKLLSNKIPPMLLIISIICLILTFSRSGILIFVIIFFTSFIKWMTNEKKLKYLIPISSVILFIFLITSSGNENFKAFNFSRINPFSQSEFIEADTSRLDVISTYLSGINESPIIGNGPSKGAKQEVRAHNTILNIWYEVGILPALAYVSFLILLSFSCHRQLWLFNTFLIYLLFSFFINNLLFHSSFWMLLGCFYVAKRNLEVSRV